MNNNGEMGRKMYGRKTTCRTKVYYKKISMADGTRLKLKILKPLDLESSHTVAFPKSGHIAHEESSSSNTQEWGVHTKSEGSSSSKDGVPGILWIHGGGYMLGGTYMSPMTCAPMLAKCSGATVVFPDYRLAWQAPFPAALEDCYAALEWMYENADDLGIDRSKIVVGGESAGGGLAAAVCIYARDKGRIPIAMQIPLYPMLDSEDTATSSDNHGRVWNTRRNHWGWRHYLGTPYRSRSICKKLSVSNLSHSESAGIESGQSEPVSKYASPARETDYSKLPPCYTFVCEGEPFYAETLTYIMNLKNAGVPAKVDVYPGNIHAFDMLRPWNKQSRLARQRLCENFLHFWA